MRIRGTSTARRVDLFDRCGKLTLTALDDDEARVLAAIMRLFTDGGTMDVRPATGEGVKWNQPVPTGGE